MAFGLNCKKCGYQETSHTMPDDYPGVCKFYVSPDKRAENAMWREERKLEAKKESRKYRGPAYEH